MSKKSVLKKLRERKKTAFARKKVAYRNFDDARALSKAARKARALASEELNSCRDKLNQEFEAMTFARDHIEENWAKYHLTRDCNRPQIESMKAQANAEHAAMVETYALAKAAREAGNKPEAASYILEGRDHEDRRNSLNQEVASLAQEIKSAKAYAKEQDEIARGTSFYRAKAKFTAAKTKYQEAEEHLKKCEDERRRLWDVFADADADYVCAKHDLTDYFNGGR